MDTSNIRRQRRSFQILNNIFKIHRYLGVFPLDIDEDGSRINLILFTASALINTVMIANAKLIRKHIDLRIDEIPNKSFCDIYFILFLIMLIIPLCHMLWIVWKRKHLHKIFKTVARVEQISHQRTLMVSKAPMVVVVCLLLLGSVEGVLAIPDVISGLGADPGFFLILVSNTLTLVIICQFIEMLNVFGHHYCCLSDKLELGNAERLTECYELIADCCEWLNHCYSPQLVLFITERFIFVTANSYFMVLSYNYSIRRFMLCLYWNFYNILLIFYVVKRCTVTKQKAKKFDKLLYHLIIYDTSNTLLRNRRVMFHLKAKRKVEFSAMGFFNFDYPLLCSIVSSATTYIVILVQFSY